MKPIKLSQPLVTHEGDLTELNLRDVTGADVFKFGFPFDLKPGAGTDGDAEFTLREKVALQYVVELSDHDQAVIEGMAPGDLFSAMWEVAGAMVPTGK